MLDQRGRLVDAGREARNTPAWDVVDDRVAAAEGWGLFDTGREPFIEVQCFDAPDPGEQTLANDTDAWECVLDGIMRGSVAHARALAMVLAHAPTEAADIVAHWAVLHQPPTPPYKEPARPATRHTKRRPAERPGPRWWPAGVPPGPGASSELGRPDS